MVYEWYLEAWNVSRGDQDCKGSGGQALWESVEGTVYVPSVEEAIERLLHVKMEHTDFLWFYSRIFLPSSNMCMLTVCIQICYYWNVKISGFVLMMSELFKSSPDADNNSPQPRASQAVARFFYWPTSEFPGSQISASEGGPASVPKVCC